MKVLLMVDLLLITLTLIALWFGVRLHQLLRTGELGRAWQFVVLGIFFLTLRELLHFARQLTGDAIRLPFLERVVEGGFLVCLCYALWRQWSAFEFLHGRTTKKTQWNRIAQSLQAAQNPTPAEAAEQQGDNPPDLSEKEWQERWYRKA